MTGRERRPCPVCGRTVATTREPVNDDRTELIAYNRHEDTIGNPCPMSGQRAAARAVGVTPQRWDIPACDTSRTSRRSSPSNACAAASSPTTTTTRKHPAPTAGGADNSTQISHATHSETW